MEKKYVITAYDLTVEGAGIARLPEGKTVFCENLHPGETAEVQLKENHTKYACASVTRYIHKSANRIDPFCDIFESCGGCTLQQISYRTQLEIKEKYVVSCIMRIGSFSGEYVSKILRPILGMEQPFFYRNHVQYQVGEDENGFQTGFFEKKTNRLIPYQNCCLVPDICHLIQNTFQEFFVSRKSGKESEKQLTEEQNGIRRLTVRLGIYSADIMLILETGGNVSFPAETFALTIQRKISIRKTAHQPFWKMKSIWEKNEKGEFRILWGDTHITEQIGDKTYFISPSSFFQVNSHQTAVLYGRIRELILQSRPEVAAEQNGTLLDLYCGTGTIGLHLSDIFDRVFGVEINAAAVSDARKNAEKNGVENYTCLLGKAELLPFSVWPDGVNCVIFDPPRKGCGKQLLFSVLQLAPQQIVYVSCDPATLARDLRVLADGGYLLREIQPLDMFPWTGHVETIVLLQRQNT